MSFREYVDDDLSEEDIKLSLKRNRSYVLKSLRVAHELLDEIDSFKNEILPEVESDNPLDDEDVQDGLEEICDNLDSIADIIGDHKLSEMVEAVDTTSQDFGIYAIQVIISSLAGFGKLNHQKDSSFVSFDENNFSLKSAQNSFLIPPNWNNYLSKKQNEVAIRVQRGLEERKERNTTHSDRMIKGSFDRDTAIKNDYIHFYAPGDEVFDCIVDNAMHSYRGMCTAFAALSSMDWKGFIYTFSIEPNERALLEEGVSLFALGQFRQYLSSSIQVVTIKLQKIKLLK